MEIPSAVVIPEPPSESPPTLKRRQSSISSTDSPKRPRLDTTLSRQSSHGSPPPSAMSPPSRRKSSAIGAGAAEERKRGQRLFGALLGTLSQTAAKPAHRRRDEIEKRQREKLRAKDEELVAEKRKKREELDVIRREEQKLWDEQSMRIRHQNLLATARFLKTKTQPYLYYKPWELRTAEKEQIKRQISEVEETIRHELAEHATRKGAERGLNDPLPHDSTNSQNGAAEGQNKGQTTEMEVDSDAVTKPDQGSSSETTNDAQEPREGGNDDPDISSLKGVAVAEPSAVENANSSHEETPPNVKMDETHHHRHQHHDDHGGEELVEGQEDDVIY